MREYRLIDADCHVVEPPHIWDRWLPKKFHDRAPKLVKDEEGHVDFLEAQVHQIKQLGYERYLTQQIGGQDHS